MIQREREASILASCQIADEEAGILNAEDEEAIAGGNRVKGDVVTFVVIAKGRIQMKGGLGNKSGDGLELVGGGHPCPMVEADYV